MTRPSEKPLCIAAVVNQGYQEYIPLYLYFILRAYPQYEVIIYFQGEMYREVTECVEMVSDLGRFAIKPLPFTFDPSSQQQLKSLRWILLDDEFFDYQSVYIGDVDMFVVPERPTLHEVHVQHSLEIGLPYSNRVRRGQRKLTGLHFVRTRAYFEAVLPTIEKYRRLVADNAITISNEELLYCMMEESVGLPRIVGNFVTLHGIHARAFSDPRGLEFHRGRDDFVFARHFEPYSVPFMEAASTELFSKMVRKLLSISYSPAALKSYGDAGPGLAKQLNVIQSLCRALEQEREQVAAPS